MMTMINELNRRLFLRNGLAASGVLAGGGLSPAAAQQDDAHTITVTGISSFGLISGFLPRFTERTGIKVNLQILPYPQLRTRAMADLVGGTANSDVYLQDIIWLGEWASKAYVRPLDALFARDAAEIKTDDLLPGAFNAMSRWDGKIWSVPVGAFYFLNYYRTDLFAEKKLPAPVTLDDVSRDAAALTDPAANRFGIAMAYQKGSPICSWFLATYAGAGGKLLTDPPSNFRPTLDSERAHTVLTAYVEWLKWAPRGAVGYHWNDQTIAMQNGRLAMAPTFSVNGTEFAKRENSVIADKLGYTYMPRLGADDAPVVPFGGWAAAMNAKSAKTEQSWQFLKFLISPETQLDLGHVSGTPVRYSSLQDAGLQKQYPWLGFILDAEKAGRIYPDYRPRYPFYPQVEEALGLQLNLAALGQIGVAEALKTANATVTGIIKEAGYPIA
jgi:multiple sugar transport system substrate-binding protein